jgi:hypothetical protein
LLFTPEDCERFLQSTGREPMKTAVPGNGPPKG